ncbi:N5-glutamine methyltransferase family protein [Methylobrevis pamukkalensis]|uniref:Release factor glutamine methyltransferase n=1 Tax=Methylobrevis pamukkalensis TaxID=1439726 RepID=A0A1E3GZJ9_9HYPH|nr:hypothetical protein [Methylobrevis pamukkalensis]ODN68751.1 Release factor glutamine methyltransferase [Methylobrevis pamukkalensis]
MSEPASLGTLLRQWRDRLAAAGSDTAALDARLIAGHVLGTDTAGLLARSDEAPDAAARTAIEALVARRVAGEPVARLFGAWEFFGRPFRLSAETLVPRPDTETLVETCLAAVRGGAIPGVGADGAGLALADLGTGSGAILVTLLAELPAARASASIFRRARWRPRRTMPWPTALPAAATSGAHPGSTALPVRSA